MTLPGLIEKLLLPDAYPHRPDRVELLQTHISYIFLTPDLVYKIKKPVDFAFLDFTTLEKRLFYCHEEVRLNRRLAPDVYMGVAAVTEEDGRVRMEGTGSPVEYAVKMKRLPEESILENKIKKGTVTEEMIERVARAIADFHGRAWTDGRISAFGSPEVIKKNTDENFSQTSDFVGLTLSRKVYEDIKGYTERFLEENRGLFIKRMEDGHIRDCHGDIHSEHISITNGIDIFDCIEFNERFRFSDTVSDLAFLSMDLDFHNRHDLARVLDSTYFSATGDAGGRALLDFYKCYRAYVRGKVEGFELKEPEVDDNEKRRARIRALHHFHLARLYATGGFRPLMVVVCGLSGTGKTVISRRLSEYTAMVHLASDVVRKRLAGLRPEEHRFEPFGRGMYSRDFTEKTYGMLISEAGRLLGSGRSVILDATFSRKKFLKDAKKEALERGAEFHIVLCTSDDETVRKRLLRRREEKTWSDALWDVYLKQKETFEPVEERHITVDTAGRDVDELINEVTWKIFN